MSSNRLSYNVLAVLMFTLARVTPAGAAVITWTGGGGNGSWHTAANWDLARVPAAGDTVLIPDLPGTASVTYSSGTTSIESLDCDEVFILSGGVLDIAAASTLDTTFTFSGTSTTLTGTGDLAINGDFTWTSADMTGSGVTTIGSGSTWTLSGSNVLLTRTLNNDGVGALQSSSFTVNAPGIIRNRAGATLALQANSSGIAGSGTLENQAGATLRRDTGLGTAGMACAATNAGTIRVETGALNISGSLANADSILVSPGATLQVSSPLISAAGSTIAVAGELRFTGGASVFDLGTALSVTGTLSFSSGGNLTLGPDLSVPTLTMTGGNLQGAGHVTVTGACTWGGGTMGGTGLTTIEPGVGWSLGSAGVTTLTRTLENFGACTTVGSTSLTLTNPGTFINRDGAIVDLQSSTGFAGTGQVLNEAGAMIRNPAGAGGTVIACALVNDGLIRVESSTVRFTASLIHNAVLESLAGTLVRMSTAFNAAAGTTVDIGGDLTFDSNTSSIDAATNFAVDGTLTVSTATLNLDADCSPDALVLSGGALQGAGDITVATSFAWSFGTLGGSGTTTIQPGATWTITPLGGVTTLSRLLVNDGSCAYTGTNVTIPAGGVLRNRSGGVIDLRSNNAFVGSSGLIENQAGGLIKRTTSAGRASVTVPIANDGEIRVESGILQLAGSVTNGSTGVVRGLSGTDLEIGTGTHTFSAGSTLDIQDDLIFVNGTTTIDPAAVVSVADTLRVNGSSVNLTNDADVTVPSLVVSSGVLTGAGNLEVSTEFTWTAGTLSGTGFVRIPPTGTGTILTGGSIPTLAREILNDGALSFGGAAALSITAAGAIRNRSGGVFTLVGDNDFSNAAGTVDNQAGALMVKSGGSSVSVIPGVFTNHGTVRVETGTLQATGTVTGFTTTTLSIGTWEILATLRLPGTSVQVNDAHIILDGPASRFLNGSGGDALPPMESVGVTGSLTLRGGRDLTLTSPGFTNQGSVVIGPGGGTLTSDNGYAQTQGSTLLDGGTVASALPVSIQGGTLSGNGTVDGDLENGGVVACGASPGLIAVTGDYAQTATGQIQVELEGLVPASEYDVLSVGGTATLDGDLEVSLPGPFAPAVPDSFDVLTATSVAGTFATDNLPLAGGGECLHAVYEPTAVRLHQSVGASVLTAPVGATVCEGDSVGFSVAPEGTPPFSIQWRKNGIDIPGATGLVLSIPATTAADAGSYDAVVTNFCGPVASDPAVLVVHTPPAFTLNPVDQPVPPGTPVTFTVAVTGEPTPDLQWRKNGSDIPGETGSSYSIASAAVSDDGVYDCVATNVCGVATSAPATLAVHQAPAFIGQPQDTTLCFGPAVTFTVSVTGTPTPELQWRKDSVPIGGATDSVFTLPQPFPADSGLYDCVAVNILGSAVSDTAALVVNIFLGITEHPQPQTLCEGQPLSLTAAAGGVPLPDFQWRKNGVDIPGATSETFTIPAVVTDDFGTYDVVVSNLCDSQTSDAAFIGVTPGVVITDQPEGGEWCGVPPFNTPFTFSVAATGAVLTYQWRRDGVDIPGAVNSDFTITAPVSSDSGDYDVIVTGTCGAVPSDVATLIVDPVLPADYVVWNPGNVAACAGGDAVFHVSVAFPELKVQWRKDGIDIPGATDTTLALSGVSAADAGAYDAVVTGGCGFSISLDGILSVSGSAPVIAIQPEGAERCGTAPFNGPFTFTVSATGDDITFQWRNGGVEIPGAVDSTFTIPGPVPADSGDYDVIVANGCAAETSAVATLFVDPVLPADFILQPPVGATFCEGDSAVLHVSVAHPALHVQWRKDSIDIPGATDTLLVIPAAVPGDSGAYDAIVSGGCGFFTSQDGILTVNPTDVLIAGQPAAVDACLGGNALFTVEATGAGLTFQWRKDTVALPGAINDTLIVSGVTAFDAGAYDVVVTGSCGGATSDPALLTVSSCPDTIFVDIDAAPGGDGASWATAFDDLQDGLAAAASAGDAREIWVAEGTYRPDISDRTVSFALLNDVAVFGGFDGTETFREARDPLANVTVLSGDLAGDDGPAFTSNAENSLHVVTATGVDSTAVLDGFSVTAGNANQGGNDQFGAGMLVLGGAAPRVANCEFVANKASKGGGAVYVTGAVPIFVNCDVTGNLAAIGGGIRLESGAQIRWTGGTVSGNTAGTDGGGGLYSAGGSAVFDGVTFGSNVAKRGAGVLNDGGALTFTNGSFQGNIAGSTLAGSGGGVAATSGSTVDLTDCAFTGNQAVLTAAIASSPQGGAVFSTGAGTTVSLTRCAFAQNFVITQGTGASGSGGGAIAQTGAGSLEVTECTFDANNGTATANTVSGGAILVTAGSAAVEASAFFGNSVFSSPLTDAGGAIAVTGSGSLALTNSLLSGNTAHASGGAISLATSAACSIVNATLSGNGASVEGAGLRLRSNSGLLTVANTILWGNVVGAAFDEPAQLFTASSTAPAVSYCDIQGLTGALGGAGNLGIDPRFTDADGVDALTGTPDDDLSLAPGSPVVDAGDNGAVPGGIVTDLVGAPRFHDDPCVADTGAGAAPLVDMGAIEFALTSCSTAAGDPPGADPTPRVGLPAPNPASGPIALRFRLDAAGPVRVEVYDVAGRRVAVLVDEALAAGEHRVAWNGDHEDGRPAGAGIYFLRARVGDDVTIRKVIRTR